MHIPESPVFNEIDPLELSWWQPHHERFPTVSRRAYRFNKTSDVEQLCTFLKVHSYLSNKEEQLKKLGGTPLVQLSIGKGTLIASELELNSGKKDPVAGKILTNLIEMLLKE